MLMYLDNFLVNISLLSMFMFQSICPVGTELEITVMDWMATSLGLPDHFQSGGKGGGVIQVNITVYHIFILS